MVIHEGTTAPYFGQGQPLACKLPVFWVFSLLTPLGHQAPCQSGTVQLLVTEDAKQQWLEQDLFLFCK